MKVFVLGANGMLGRYVFKYFDNKGYDVEPITRKYMDFLEYRTAERIEEGLYLYTGRELQEDDVIINCVGLIPHRKKEQSNDKYVVLNALLPQLLDEICKKHGCKLIHISTDCVFDGEKHSGTYTEDSVPNARDMYGRSKALGEMIDSTVIRTSIIGEELNNKYSLLEWVKSNKGGEINGFTNQRWSGVTCLTVAKIMEKIVSEKLYWRGVRNLESTDVTKYELVKSINAVYDLGIKINPVESEHAHDKVLTTVLPKIFDIPTISAQIEELSEFDLS